MSTLDEEAGHFVVFVKGAIDTLIPNCTHVQANGAVMPITDDHRAQFKTMTDHMSGQALRTLASAYKPVDTVIESEDMEKGLILIGMVGMIDPPRTEVKESIANAAGAGIKTIMITGDHKKTAYAIAQDLQIADDPEQAITGEELNRFSEEELVQNIHRYRVFARVSPTHKVKIVRAFKSGGNIVSMTGDGVNDAPSLSTADIGVAMGRTGTDVAKNASDMILADDNFSTIVVAIEQGRNIYNNIKKSVIFLLASNLGEVIAMVVAILAGMPAPLLATQLLWINLVTDTLPAIALGMGPGDPDVMKLTPRASGESFFAKGAGQRVVVGGLFIGLLTVFGFWLGYYEKGFSPFDSGIPEMVHRYARTMAFMTIITCQLLYATTFKHPSRSVFRSGLLSDRILVGAILIGILLQLIVIIIPSVRGAFKLDMLSARGWVSIAAIGVVPVLVNEITKIFIRGKERRNARHS
jgi:Ca2+-transporting ATPase